MDNIPQYNKAIAKLMDYPEHNAQYIMHNTDELLLVLMKMSRHGYKWRISINTNHDDEFAVRITDLNNKRLYSYSRKLATALYNAIGAILTSKS